MRLYHGTTAQLRDAILREGLRLRTPNGWVYLAPDEDTAWEYAWRMTAALGRRRALVLTVELDERDVVEDPSSAGQRCVRGVVPPSAIVGTAEKRRVDGLRASLHAISSRLGAHAHSLDGDVAMTWSWRNRRRWRCGCGARARQGGSLPVGWVRAGFLPRCAECQRRVREQAAAAKVATIVPPPEPPVRARQLSPSGAARERARATAEQRPDPARSDVLTVRHGSG
jgi:hypothetical protein